MPLSQLAAVTQLSRDVCLGALLPCPVLTAPEAALLQEYSRGGGWGPGSSTKGSKASWGGIGSEKAGLGCHEQEVGFETYLRKRVQGEGRDGADRQ